MTREQMIEAGIVTPAGCAQVRVPEVKSYLCESLIPAGRGREKTFGSDAWWGDCGRKIAHFNIASAVRHALSLYVKERQRIRIYVCPYCDWFHVARAKFPATSPTEKDKG